jgi:acetylglutamate kinase
VGAAHILDGRVPHSLLLEVFTNAGIGTMVVASAKGLTKATGPAPCS